MGSDASPSMLWKNPDNQTISYNYGKSVTSMVFCLCKAKGIMKDASIMDEAVRLNKIRQVNESHQTKYFHKKGSGKERKTAVTNSKPFFKCFSPFYFIPILCFK